MSEDSTGRKQHYIPASHIGRFSGDWDGRLRERRVWVQRVGNKVPFHTKAQGVGAINDMYTLRNPGPTGEYSIDPTWKYVESKLDHAVSELSNNQDDFFDVVTWSTVLVPFVAQLFIRSPAFDDHYEIRAPWMEALSDIVDEPVDQIHAARLIDFQAICGLLINAQWKLFFNLSGTPLILNDCGFVPFVDRIDRTTGYAVPLSPGMILLIAQRDTPTVDVTLYRRINTQEKVIWLPQEILPPNEVDSCNAQIAIQARTEIYGPTREVVSSSWKKRMRQKTIFPISGDLLIPSGEKRTVWMNEYFRFLQFVGIPMETIKEALGGRYVVTLRAKT